MAEREVKVPALGDTEAAEIIEILVQVGDTVAKDDPLITLESDKASLDVPSTAAGKITKIQVKEGETVSEGDVIVSLEAETKNSARQAEPEKVDSKASTASTPQQDSSPSSGQQAPASPQPADSGDDYDCDVLVLGSGPGGYSAAFRAADLGQKVVLVERYPTLGGVCLNVGCIPSKALLHAAKVIDEAAQLSENGVAFSKPTIDIKALRRWKQRPVDKLTGGIAALARRRKVEVMQGAGRFSGLHEVAMDTPDGGRSITFAKAIIAAGASAVKLPMLPDDERIVTSTGALELPDVPSKLLVIGGGIIGLEMADVFAALGSAVDVVEMTDSLLPGTDADLVKPLEKTLRARCRDIYLSTKVTGANARKDGIQVSFEGEDAPANRRYDRVLGAVGRKPNGHLIGAELAGVAVEDSGFITTDKQMRTNVDHIFAIGDVAGPPQLAHKAVHEGKVAAEVCAGEKSAFDARCIPSIVYTDPEVAWTGLTETQIKEQGIAYNKGRFPWAANGRALGMGYEDGLTKTLFDKNTGQLIGAAAVGPNAGDLMGELSLAIEMGCVAEDIGLTIHAHPTLSETVGMSAEAVAGTLTDL